MKKMNEEEYIEEYKKTLALDITWTPTKTDDLVLRYLGEIEKLSRYFVITPWNSSGLFNRSLFHIEDAQYEVGSLIERLIRVPDQEHKDVQKTLEILERYKQKLDFIERF